MSDNIFSCKVNQSTKSFSVQKTISGNTLLFLGTKNLIFQMVSTLKCSGCVHAVHLRDQLAAEIKSTYTCYDVIIQALCSIQPAGVSIQS